LNEHDINSLVVNFDPGAAGGESATSQGGSNSDSGAGAFAQNMARQVLPNQGSATNSTQSASQVLMSEVYDQLSDKMATEMAARMHKQLSDGEWKMKFGLRPANLGGVEIQLEMKDGKLNAMIQADNPLTRDLLQNSSQRLRDALENFGIQAGQVQIGHDNRGAQQNPSKNASKQAQVGDNSLSQVKGSDSTTGDVAATAKASASLLDLYA
jgi:flagellar hook-length control protein FliK